MRKLVWLLVIAWNIWLFSLSAQREREYQDWQMAQYHAHNRHTLECRPCEIPLYIGQDPTFPQRSTRDF
jgi:hypothetical protein